MESGGVLVVRILSGEMQRFNSAAAEEVTVGGDRLKLDKGGADFDFTKTC